MKIKIFIGFIVVFCCFSCGNKNSQQASFCTGRMEYARLLLLEKRQNVTIARIRSPWDTTAILHTYLLVPDSIEIPDDLPEGTLLRTPLQRLGVSTTVHCGLFEELGCTESICGVFESNNMHFDWVENGLKNGTITDFGSCMNPTLEHIMVTKPDAIFLTPFAHSGGYGRLEQMGIPVIECAEYMEYSPLGEAEWMRFYAALVGKTAYGERIFQEVRNKYLTLKEKASHVVTRPKVLTELMVGTTWYVPGGQSTMGQLLADAGADYVYASTPENGSLAYPFEKVFSDAQDADFWLIKYDQKSPISYDEIGKNYTPYQYFKAFQEHHIWACNLATSRFYDEAPFHPERTLENFISIFHRALLPENIHTYFSPLP